MRFRSEILLAAGLWAAVPAQKAPDADAMLAAGATAIGAASTPVRSLDIHGHRRVMIGSTGKLSEPRPLDIRILVPDRFLRITIDEYSESLDIGIG